MDAHDQQTAVKKSRKQKTLLNDLKVVRSDCYRGTILRSLFGHLIRP